MEDEKWEKWFAWHPVIAIEHFPYKEVLVWFKFVWRKKHKDIVFDRNMTSYRTSEPPVDKNTYWMY